MIEAIIFGLAASGGVLSLLFTIASGFLALEISPWWLISFVLCGLLTGVLLAVTVYISEKM